jgi:cell division protease FtsH
MVMNYGMSDVLGLPIYGAQSTNPFLGRDYGLGGRDYSEDAAKSIDEEVKNILDRNYKRALEIIRTHKQKIVALAAALMEVETMDRDTFERLMNAPTTDESANGAHDASEASESLVGETAAASD